MDLAAATLPEGLASILGWRFSAVLDGLLILSYATSHTIVSPRMARQCEIYPMVFMAYKMDEPSVGRGLSFLNSNLENLIKLPVLWR